DRGPFVKGRILDLSHAAAMQIALVGPGTAKVKLTVIAAPPVVEVAASRQEPVEPRAAELYAVQVGAFSDRRNAERVRDSMAVRCGSAQIVMRDGHLPSGVYWSGGKRPRKPPRRSRKESVSKGRMRS